MWPSCVCPVICEASTGVCGWTCNLEGEQTWKDSNINEVRLWAPAVLCWIAFPRIGNTIDILLFRRVVSTEILSHIIHLDICIRKFSPFHYLHVQGTARKRLVFSSPNVKLWFIVYLSFFILFHFYSLLTKFRTTSGVAAYATVIFPVKTRRPIHRGEYRDDDYNIRYNTRNDVTCLYLNTNFSIQEKSSKFFSSSSWASSGRAAGGRGTIRTDA
jgi:hypothetical protein